MVQQNRNNKQSLITGYEIPNDFEFPAVSLVILLHDIHAPALKF